MNQSSPVIVSCPTCKKPVIWSADQPYKPFCSQRCRLIDLGDWATEAHKIAGDPVFLQDDAESDR